MLRRKFRCIMALFLSLSLVLPFGSMRVKAATEVTIDPGTQFQTLEGWGTTLAWWADAIGNWTDETKKNEILDLVFSPTNGLGLNIARYNIGGSENPEHEHMRPGGEVPGFQVVPGVYDWSADAGQRAVLKGAIDRGVNITEAFSNSPPYWMTYSKCTAGSVNGLSNNLYDDSYDAFADYLTEVVKHFRDFWGVNFRTVSPINEPWTPTAWKAGGIQEGCHYDVSKQSQIMASLKKKLVEKGLQTKVSGPEENFIDWNVSHYNQYDQSGRDAIAQLNVHSYNGTERAQAKALAFKENKKLWMSEVSWGGDGSGSHEDMTAAFNIANGVMMDMKWMQPEAWVHWQIVENEVNSDWGLIHANFEGTPGYSTTKSYYAFANFTKFIRPGYKFIGGFDNDNVLAAYDEASRKVVFVVKNGGDSAIDYTYNLSKFTSIGSTAKVYRTSPTENLVQLADKSISNKMLVDTLPAKSITTYVIENAYPSNSRVLNDIEVGTGLNKINYNGNWGFAYDGNTYYWDNHYSGNANDYYTISFYGTQVKIMGTKDMKFGKMAVSIDGGPEAIVDCYNISRINWQNLYTSSTLTRGQHTIKVRVTGTKNFWSTGTTVTLDRVDIID